MSFPDYENLLKEVMVRLALFLNAKRAKSRKLGQRPILIKKSTTYFTIPYSNQFLSVLHENKALYNLIKRGRVLKLDVAFA